MEVAAAGMGIELLFGLAATFFQGSADSLSTLATQVWSALR